MRTKNGFFATSIIYSFFLVFALISAILLSNYAHNRFLVRDFNAEIKNDLNARGNNKLANLKNLLQDSDFESGTDTYFKTTGSASKVINQHYNGSFSIKLDNGSGSITERLDQEYFKKLKYNGLQNGHIYYLQRRYYTFGQTVNFSNANTYLKGTNDNGTTNVYAFKTLDYNNVDNPNLLIEQSLFSNLNTISLNGTFNWGVLGSIVKVNSTAKTWDFVMEYNYSGNIPIYFDSFILIDLTKAYGNDINTYPSIAWLNRSISIVSFIDNKYIINKSDSRNDNNVKTYYSSL